MENRCPRTVCNGFVRNVYSLAIIEKPERSANYDGLLVKTGKRWYGDVIQWNMFMEAVHASCPICNMIRSALLCFLPGGNVKSDKPFLRLAVMKKREQSRPVSRAYFLERRLTLVGRTQFTYMPLKIPSRATGPCCTFLQTGVILASKPNSKASTHG